MKRKITIGVLGAGLLGVSLGLGSAALAATGASAPGTSSAHTQTVHGAPSGAGAAKRGGPLIKPLPVDPSVVAAGGSVTVNVANCNPGTQTFLSLGGADKPRDLATVRADARGVFSGSVRIPADTPIGHESLWAACMAPNPTGKLLHTAVITITR